VFLLKLIDDLFEHYRSRLSGDEDDIDILALAVLEQLNDGEILEHIKEMSEMELRSFFAMYIVESLKAKFSETNPSQVKEPFHSDHRNIH